MPFSVASTLEKHMRKCAAGNGSAGKILKPQLNLCRSYSQWHDYRVFIKEGQKVNA